MKKIQKLLFLIAIIFFTLAPNLTRTEAATASGYLGEGTAFFAFSAPQVTLTPAPIPIYQLYSSKMSDHLFTASALEKDRAIASGFTYQKIAFYAFNTLQPNTVPVYRLWNIKGLDHFFTTSSTEKDRAVTIGFKYEGIAFYAFPSQQADTLPVYRLWNPAIINHFYTISEEEKDNLLKEKAPNYGPEITVGIWSTPRADLHTTAFQLKANKNYFIKDTSGKVLGTIPAATSTSVRYDTDGKLKISGSIPDVIVSKEVLFDAADGKNADLIFELSNPTTSYNKYRGKIKLRYSDVSQKVWAINTLPLEQYVWGIGEITGTGAIEYNRTMTTIFRTYGYWKILYSTKYATEGFKIDATPGNQLYYGYNWEQNYPNIKIAAEYTLGRIITYKGSTALTPYSSWTDGRTRSYQEVWNSTSYPYLKSVPDSYGKHPTMTTAQLKAAGNHMVGVSAHGALKLATNYAWTWNRILSYYYTGIALTSLYLR
jgi:peptidoglycan hydrolase-like amidase